MPVVEKTTCDGNACDLKPNLEQPHGLNLLYVTKKYLHLPHNIYFLFFISSDATLIYLSILRWDIVDHQESTLILQRGSQTL